MPAHPMHENLDVMIFGRRHPEVHDALDIFAKDIGPEHRKMYHDYDTVLCIAQETMDPEITWCAYYHIVLDLVSDRVKAESCLAEFLKLYMLGVIPEYNPEMIPPMIQKRY